METKSQKNQIEQQKETIESLTKKVENLERELQKCLDPDSGEFKFEGIKKTIEDSDDWSAKYYRMIDKAEEILRGVFGEWDEVGVYEEPWLKFRNFLLSDEKLDAFRSDEDFKWGVFQVVSVYELLVKGEEEADVDEKHRLFGNINDLFIGDLKLGEVSDHESVLKLLECFKILGPVSDRYCLKEADLIVLEIDLQTIKYCQELSMRAYKEDNNKD